MRPFLLRAKGADQDDVSGEGIEFGNSMVAVCIFKHGRSLMYFRDMPEFERYLHDTGDLYEVPKLKRTTVLESKDFERGWGRRSGSIVEGTTRICGECDRKQTFKNGRWQRLHYSTCTKWRKRKVVLRAPDVNHTTPAPDPDEDGGACTGGSYIGVDATTRKCKTCWAVQTIINQVWTGAHRADCKNYALEVRNGLHPGVVQAST